MSARTEFERTAGADAGGVPADDRGPDRTSPPLDGLQPVRARLGTPTDRSLRRLDAALILLVGLLTLVSLAVWLDPGLSGVVNAEALDLAVNVAAALVATAVAILGWIRWRETGAAVALYESAAFVVLAATSTVMVGIVLVGRESTFGLDPTSPGEAAIYVWTLTRLAAAVLLVIGAIRGLRRTVPPLPPIVTALGPVVLVVVASLMLFARETTLPPVPAGEAFIPGRPTPLELTPIGTVIVLVQVLIFAGFIVAAILFRRLYLRDRLVSHAFLAAGLVVAAFSQLHFALDPVVAAGIVTSTDALRLAFSAILFMGIQAEIQSDLSALRRANGDLRRLGEVEAANAALAERSRLAREIHDGLAQDLWYAKLKQGRLAHEASLDETARATAGDVLRAIDSALAEARQAVMAMREDRGSGGSLEDVLRSYVDDFSDRFGVRSEFVVTGTIPRLAPRVEAEVLRIVQEALNNVRRHADATLVRVSAIVSAGSVSITVGDNGRGFDPGGVSDGRFGLRGMRERAELVGAALTVDSRPADGTRVTLDVPLAKATV